MISETFPAIILELLFNQLLFLTAAGYTLPVVIGFAIKFYATNTYKIAFEDIKKISCTCLILSLCGVLAAFAEPVILYCNLCFQGLTPSVPNFFDKGMLAYTICALCHGVGVMMLMLFQSKLSLLPVQKHNKKHLHLLYILLTLSLLFFFFSIMIKNWPFAKYPDGISQGYLLLLLMQQALHLIMISFVPAGICVLLYSIFIFKHKRFANDEDKDFQHQIVRYASLFCVLGLAPKAIVSLGYLAQYFLYGSLMRQLNSLVMENFFLLGSILTFIVLLLPRFSKCRALQYMAIVVYIIVWNWRSLFVTAQSFMTI